MSGKGQNPLDNIKITVTSAEGEEGGSSPRFGEKEVHEALETVGKHGKSHHQYMKVMGQHKAASEMRKISLQELSEHHTPASAWLSLNGLVYDVTVYLHYHPGGDIILKGCGK
jgi:cytochrome b involved in lipid metabolism